MNIADTPVAPYLNLLNGMNRNEKIALASFLLDSLSGVKIVETIDDDISAEDEEFLAQKIGEMSFSPRIERLFAKRKEAAKMVDLEDERTRHILGLQ